MGLYLLIPTFVVVMVSILIVRAGAIALRMTGLDEKTANFQALSAFTRAGFTTKESESVVSHPQRRNIVSWLIILGNAGIAAVIVTGTSSLATSTDYRLVIDIVVLGVGMFLIYRLAQHTTLTQKWERLIENKLVRGRFFASVSVEHLLHLPGGHGVARIAITENSQLIGSRIDHSRLPQTDFVVLGIEREGEWIPAERYGETLDAGDTIILYGKLNDVDATLGRRGNVKT